MLHYQSCYRTTLTVNSKVLVRQFALRLQPTSAQGDKRQMPTVSEILNDAHRLIEEGQHAKARSLLEPLLQTNSQDPDVWWIYAHAVEDEERGRDALERVVTLAPDYPGIAALWREADKGPLAPQIKSLKRLPQRELAGETAMVTDEMPGADMAENPAVPTESVQLPTKVVGPDEPAHERTRPSWLYFVAAALVVVVVVLFLLNSGNEQPVTVDEQATETAIAIVSGQSALTPTQVTPEQTASEIAETPDTPETPVVSTSESVDQSAQTTALREAFTEIEFADEALVNSATSLGSTTVVQVCTIPGPNAGSIIEQILSWSASNLSIDDDISAVGVRLFDCDSSQVLRTIAVPIDLIRALGAGEISIRELETALQPVE